ncbi:MAG: hypothetical protein HUJ73_02840, partial [Eubacterium sp.]|nr:hypothetical protein [Eubacterium sp.]
SQESFVYDGSEKKPAVTVVNADGDLLTENLHYTVRYANNIKPGKAEVTVTGTGKETETKDPEKQVRYTGSVRKTFTINGWYSRDGVKYYYKDGSAVKGWQAIGGKRYYFTSDGGMATGWKTIGEKKYFFKSDGTMAAGWQTIKGNRYYFTSSGAMVTGWKKIGGQKYYFTSAGKMVTGWKTIGGKRFYFKSDGLRATGWKTIDDKRYYFSGEGVMTTGQKKIGKYWYMFDVKTGVMKTGFFKHTRKTNPDGAKKVYYDSKGRMCFGQKKIGKYWYMFDMKTGAMKKGWFKHTIKTNKDGAKTCYYDEDGRMAFGWYYIDEKWCYFNKKTGAYNPNKGESSAYTQLNAYRRSSGLPGLVRDEALEKTALLRAKELQKNFSHTRPDGSSCFTAYPEELWFMGENIAWGYERSADVMNAWIDSPGHRGNILSGEYTKVGVACYRASDGICYWVQSFGG